MSTAITVFQHADFGGSRLIVDGDQATLPGSFDRQISSARVHSPVAMFTEPRFGGDIAVVNSDVQRFSALRGRNLNDKIRSIRVEPLRLRLNVTIGVDGDSKPSKSAAEVAEHVATCNELFGMWGIEVEAVDLRVVEGLAFPMTGTRQDELIKPYLRNDAANVLYFGGTHWKSEAWRWRAKSFEVSAVSGGTPKAELFSEVNFGGTKTTIGGDQPTSTDLSGTKSVRVHDGSTVAIYANTRQRGAQLDLFEDEPDLSQRRLIWNWWGGSLLGHCCHGPGRLVRLNQASGRLTLAHEIGHLLGLPHVSDRANLMFPSSNGGTIVTAEQAEIMWDAALRDNSHRGRFI